MNFDDCIKKGLVRITAENKAISSSLVRLAGIRLGDIGRFIRKGVEKLAENERKLLEMIQNNPKISKAAMSKELSRKTVEYNLGLLKRKGIIKRIGPDKGGYWEAMA